MSDFGHKRTDREITSSSYVYFMYFQLALFGYLDWGFPCFFLSCRANAKVKPAKMGHGPHSSKIFVLFYALFLCKCVLYYCHRVATQFQLTNIYHITIYIISYLISYHIVSYIISYRIISYRIISYRIVSCNIYHIISYRIVSYIISYRIVSILS
jgi:hypothetical protein